MIMPRDEIVPSNWFKSIATGGLAENATMTETATSTTVVADSTYEGSSKSFPCSSYLGISAPS